MSNPKLFISYSWTSPAHEARVLQIATELVESGVDVILDKWDLREGHDAVAFMEKMVTDPEIKKVLIICDQRYAQKTDARSGGVGTEAQIISAKIYESQAQDKFVALVTERDDSGKPCLPTYYKSRIYIDFTDPSRTAESFEQLVRWAHNKPLYVKPALGKPPAYLEGSASGQQLLTSSRFRRAIDSIVNGRDYANAAISDYLENLSDEIEKLRIDQEIELFDDAVVKSIDDFLITRNQAIELFMTIARYGDSDETRNSLHRFFESLIRYMGPIEGMTRWHDSAFDNFKFVIHELYLYAIASFIKYERFETAAHLIHSDYYVSGRSAYGRDEMVSFEVFHGYLRSLEGRNNRLNLRRLSLRADMLRERCKEVGVNFAQIMQADFVLYLCAELDNQRSWWPETLLYVGRHSGPFELFARSRSAKYFSRAQQLFNISNKDPLVALVAAFRAGNLKAPRWEFESFSPGALIDLDNIATKQ